MAMTRAEIEALQDKRARTIGRRESASGEDHKANSARGPNPNNHTHAEFMTPPLMTFVFTKGLP
jgi:hypothetical protein